MADTQYCSYCGQPLDEGSTFCVYCQLDSKDFKYDIQQKDYNEIRLVRRITKQVMIVSIFSIVFAFLSMIDMITYINYIVFILVFGSGLLLASIFALINVRKPRYEEEPFMISILVMDAIYLIISIISVIFYREHYYAVHYASAFIHIFGLSTSLIICMEYLKTIKEYKKLSRSPKANEERSN